MIYLNDYNAWLKDNNDFLMMLKDNNSSVYHRLMDVFKILEYIESLYNSQKSIESELAEIFEFGYAYLFDTIEEVKLYYENYFNRDYILFSKYESLINYILYLDDLKNSLIDAEALTETAKQLFDQILEECDEYIRGSKEYSIDVLDTFNVQLDLELGDAEVLTVLEIFEKIYEELFI